MWEKHWSEPVVKLVVWLAGLVPFEQAAVILEKVGRIEISTSSVWRHMDKWGTRLKVVTEARQATLMGPPSRGEVVKGERREPRLRMGVAMDGAMVHIRGEGWKELEVGCVLELGVRQTPRALDKSADSSLKRRFPAPLFSVAVDPVVKTTTDNEQGVVLDRDRLSYCQCITFATPVNRSCVDLLSFQCQSTVPTQRAGS
jgi:hypothetical protein